MTWGDNKKDHASFCEGDKKQRCNGNNQGISSAKVLMQPTTLASVNMGDKMSQK